MSTLLEQFLSEARDLLDEASGGLLRLEREPGDEETVHAVFRAVHTLKGGSALFPFAPLTSALHAGEDLLDAVRRRELALTGAVVDALLACVDRAAAWLDEAGRAGSLPPEAEAESTALAQRLRSLRARPTSAPPPAEPGAASVPVGSVTLCLRAEAEGLVRAGDEVVWVQYDPAPGCFFQGDDPLRVVRELPGLAAFVVVPPAQGWPALSELDPYVCAVRFEALCRAPRAEVLAHLAYVVDQVRVAAVAPEEAPDEALTLRTVLRDQLDALRLAGDEADRRARLRGVCEVAANALGFAGRDDDARRLRARSEAEDVNGALRALEAWLAPTAKDPAASTAAAERPRGAPMLKVDQSKIDLVMNLVGELVVAKNGLPYLARRADESMARAIREQYAVLHRIADALQGAVMQIRMMPVGHALQRFPRMVRDLARALQKEVTLSLEGEETEADKTVLERLAEPLTHLVRNSLDHGLETPDERERAGKARAGSLRLAVRHEGDRIVLEIADDGRGVDPALVRRKAVSRGMMDEAAAARLGDEEAIQLIFAPGFSTAEQVTSVSGRGVGMDAVRREIESLGGRVEVRARKGEGTTVRLTLPVTLAVSRVLLVRLGDERYGVPMESVVGAVRASARELATVRRDRLFLWRGKLLPVVDLGVALGLDGRADADEMALLVVDLGGHRIALAVDAFDADVNVVLKPLEGVLEGCRGFAGTAILGDGRVLLVLNPQEVIAWELRTNAAA